MSANLQNVALIFARAAKPSHNSRTRERLHLSTKTRGLAARLKPLAAISAFCILLSICPFKAFAQPGPSPNSAGLAPLLFERNNVPGSPVRYLGRAARYTLFLCDDEADIVLQQEKTPSQKLHRGGLIVVEAHASLLRMRFVGADPPTSIIPVDRIGRSRAPFAAVAYRGLYPGTDVILRGDQQRVQLQVNLGPGASSAENIVVELAGATSLSLDANGDAIVRTGRASLLLQKPVFFFGRNQTKESVPAGFRIENGNRLRLVLGASTSAPSRILGD